MPMVSTFVYFFLYSHKFWFLNYDKIYQRKIIRRIGTLIFPFRYPEQSIFCLTKVLYNSLFMLRILPFKTWNGYQENHDAMILD